MDLGDFQITKSVEVEEAEEVEVEGRIALPQVNLKKEEIWRQSNQFRTSVLSCQA